MSIKKTISVFLSVMIMLTTICGFFSVTANAEGTVIYSFVITTDETVNAMDGEIHFPASLSVKEITFNGQKNTKNGKVLFNDSNASVPFDFSGGKAAITIEFNVNGEYNAEDVYGGMTEFYSNLLVDQGNIPFDYANVINGEIVSCGHTDIDTPADSYEKTKYSLTYNYKESPEAETFSTIEKSIWSELKDAKNIAEINLPNIANPYYTYSVYSAYFSTDGKRINVFLDETAKNYTVTWSNYNGDVLDTDEAAVGTTPSFGGATPARASEAYYDYIFAGWIPEVAAVTADAVYTAEFNKTLKSGYNELCAYRDEFTLLSNVEEFDAEAGNEAAQFEAGKLMIWSSDTSPSGTKGFNAFSTNKYGFECFDEDGNKINAEVSTQKNLVGGFYGYSSTIDFDTYRDFVYIEAVELSEAKVGTTKYDTVAEAVAAAGASSGNTVQLLKDCAAKVTCNSLANPITIDLNGYRISNNGASTTSYALEIDNSAVTVVDSSAGKSGLITSAEGKAVYIGNSAKVNLNDISVTGGNGAVYIYNGELVIDGGSYSTTKSNQTVIDVYSSAAKIYGGSFNSYNCCNVYSSNSNVMITGGTFTASYYQKTSSGKIYTDSSYGGIIRIIGGLFHQNVTEYCVDGYECVESEVPEMYTVITANPLNPINKKATQINDGNAFGLSADYLMGTLLGVQSKSVAGAGTSSQETGRDIRFIACLDTEILRVADNYGFILAKLNNSKTFENTNFDNLRVNGGNGEKTIYCKGTANTVCSNLAYGNPVDDSTDYKYITCGVNGIDGSDKVVARFFVELNGKVYYAKYSGHDYKYTGCLVSWDDVAQGG